jgi:N-acyl-L-homoserine lactone synthetase
VFQQVLGPVHRLRRAGFTTTRLGPEHRYLEKPMLTCRYSFKISKAEQSNTRIKDQKRGKPEITGNQSSSQPATLRMSSTGDK